MSGAAFGEAQSRGTGEAERNEAVGLYSYGKLCFITQ